MMNSITKFHLRELNTSFTEIDSGSTNRNQFLEFYKKLTQGLIYNHIRINDNTKRSLEASSFAYALIELLAEKGIITIEELDEQKKDFAERLIKSSRRLV
jgi:hypothetical protein